MKIIVSPHGGLDVDGLVKCGVLTVEDGEMLDGVCFCEESD